MDAWAGQAGGLDDPLRGCVELFLLARPLDRRRAVKILGAELVQALLNSAILETTPEGIRSAGMLLISFRSFLFFCEHARVPRVYFGDDSIALGLHQQASFGDVALDLCAGTGIQAMIAALRCRRVTAVEVDARAAAIAKINVRMNHLERRITVVNASLEEFSERTLPAFDLITFNPPLLPIPPEVEFPIVGNGGADGLDVTRRALSLYLPRLTPRGSMQFIGCGLGRNGTPAFPDQLLAPLAEYDAAGRVLIFGSARLRRGDPFYDAFIHTAASNGTAPVDDVYDIFGRHFRRLKMTELYTFFMRIERRGKRGRRRIEVTNLADGSYRWLVR